MCIYFGGSPVSGVSIAELGTTGGDGCVGTSSAAFGVYTLHISYPGVASFTETVNHTSDGDRFEFRY